MHRDVIKFFIDELLKEIEDMTKEEYEVIFKRAEGLYIDHVAEMKQRAKRLPNVYEQYMEKMRPIVDQECPDLTKAQKQEECRRRYREENNIKNLVKNNTCKAKLISKKKQKDICGKKCEGDYCGIHLKKGG